jgi:hypothetical protein
MGYILVWIWVVLVVLFCVGVFLLCRHKELWDDGEFYDCSEDCDARCDGRYLCRDCEKVPDRPER